MDEKYDGSILLVDDNDLVLETTAQLLRLYGFTVTACNDSTKALDIMGDIEPELLITDVRMPEVTGTELAKTMRRFDVQIPIIIITGFAEVDMVIEALRLHVFDLIKKPYSPGYLTAAAHRAITRYRQQRQLASQPPPAHQNRDDRLFLLEMGGLAEDLRSCLDQLPSGDPQTPENQLLISARMQALRLSLALRNRLQAKGTHGA